MKVTFNLLELKLNALACETSILLNKMALENLERTLKKINKGYKESDGQ